MDFDIHLDFLPLENYLPALHSKVYLFSFCYLYFTFIYVCALCVPGSGRSEEGIESLELELLAVSRC